MGAGFTKGTSRIGHTLLQHKECLKANLAFQSGSSSSPGYLSVGLITGIGTISSYVIEWHLGSPTGSIIFKSGLNPNETVNAIHPFTNEPVTSGNLYAVVKYIVINGIKYSSYVGIGQYSPDLKICFNYISISGINCSSGIAGIWAYTFAYRNTSDPAIDASRDVLFDLNSDGTSKYVAWRFEGELVVDRLTISYIYANGSTPLIVSNWDIGTGVVTNFTLNPKRFGTNYGQLNQIVDLRSIPYNIGDKLLFKVTPRVFDVNNTNTNWTLKLKCIDEVYCYQPGPLFRVFDPTTPVVTYNGTTCKYVVTWYNKDRFIYPNSSYYIYHSLVPSSLTSGVSYGYYDTGMFSAEISLSRTLTAGTAGSFAGSCINTTPVRVTKVGNIYTWYFSDYAEYYRYKNIYVNIIQPNANFINYTSDNTDWNHYKSLYFYLYVAPNCGDAYINKAFEIHYSSIFTWDDTNFIMTIDVRSTTNGMTSLPSCDTAVSSLNSKIGTWNYAITSPNFDVTIGRVFTNPFFGYYQFPAYTPLSKILYARVNGFNSILFPICMPGGHTYSNNVEFYARIGYYTVTITDPLDGVNNFKIENRLTEDGTQVDLFLVYEKVNGVQTFPV